MATNQKITKRLVDQIPAPEKDQSFVWDTDVKGFGLRITATGAKAYVFQYKNQSGRNRRMTLGKHGSITADQAREIARELYIEVRKGKDPLADKSAHRGAPDVCALCDDYITRHARPKKRPRSLEGDLSLIERFIKPEIGAMKVQDVELRDIEKVAALLSDKPTTANRLVALLSKMFNLAKSWKWRDTNPTEGWQKHQEFKRERPLSEEELQRLYRVMEEHPNQTACNIVRLLLLTGARRGEVLNMCWKDLNFEKGVWTKPAHNTKQKRTEHLPLSEGALSLLKHIRDTRDESAPSKFVFPGRVPEEPITTIKTFWGRIRKEADIEDARLHDLRHTTATVMAGAGASLPMIGRQLGHTQYQTTLRYAHLYQDDLRQSANSLSNALNSITKPSNEN
ncbi:site-specific integrase [uncultured Roseibium sp.]|uniref:tyrosine-type recombinase/integrase n=1 Tax=uncultured Roseibium sp. TaxID=1936171 RepID=UPI0026184D15|nr:site-specific integrase [uncultured Roseibium sp.]